jgi:phospholipase C
MFDQLGPRVPAVVISPLIPKGTIEHRLLEHCSVISTVCDLFDVPPLNHARDLRGVCGLLHLAQLSEPRTDTPARLPEVVVSGVPSGAAPSDTQDSMIATTLRVAAVRNMALEPERKREIIERVSRMRTHTEAIAFVKEVDAKLEASRPR